MQVEGERRGKQPSAFLSCQYTISYWHSSNFSSISTPTPGNPVLQILPLSSPPACLAGGQHSLAMSNIPAIHTTASGAPRGQRSHASSSILVTQCLLTQLGIWDVSEFQSSTSVVLSLFGTRDWFRGRQFFHGCGWGWDGLGTIQGYYIYGALYFNLMLLLIWQEVLVRGPEAGDPCCM